VGDAETFAAGVDEFALQVFGGRVGNGMNKDVELTVFFLQRGKERFDFAVDGYIALESAGPGEFVNQVFGLGAHALVLITDGQGGSGCGEFLGDAPRDGTLVGQPEDDSGFARQIDHAFPVPLRLAHGLGSCGASRFLEYQADSET